MILVIEKGRIIRMLSDVKDEKAFFTRMYKNRNHDEEKVKILKKMTRKQTNALSEVALNVRFGAIGVAGEKRRRLQAMKPFIRSISAVGAGPIIRKRIALSHPAETFTLIELVYTNLNNLIWRSQ